MSVTRKRAVFAGCARNCAHFLPAVLDNFDRCAGLFADSAVVIVENDSEDATRAMLEQWARTFPNFHAVLLPEMSSRISARTVRLAEARNHYIERIRRSALADFDYLFAFDCDEVNVTAIDPAKVAQAIEFLESRPEHAAVFANQTGCYYDLWTLRHPQLCPDDIFEQQLAYVLEQGMTDEEAYELTFKKRHLVLPANGAPIEVASAFGGLGIYKIAYAKNARYVGQKHRTIRLRTGATIDLRIEVCEHVAFNSDIAAQGGRLFILPWLINAHFERDDDLVQRGVSTYRRFVISPDRLLLP